MKVKCRAVLLALAALLMTGCEGRPISQQLVVAAMGVDLSRMPWHAVLEIMQEDENKIYTVTGESFAAIGTEAERRFGYPVYWGAMECVLISGAEMEETLRDFLLALNREPQVGANTQIALCDDAAALLSDEKIEGSVISSLLTGQYSHSSDYSLVTVLDALLEDDSGMLLPFIGFSGDALQVAGYIPSRTADYAAPWGGNTLLDLLTGRRDEQTTEVMAEGTAADVQLTECRRSSVRFTNTHSAETAVMVTATLLDTSDNAILRSTLENELRNVLLRELEEIRSIVVQHGKTDFFRIGWHAKWQGIPTMPNADDITFRIELNLLDPKELLRE